MTALTKLTVLLLVRTALALHAEEPNQATQTIVQQGANGLLRAYGDPGGRYSSPAIRLDIGIPGQVTSRFCRWRSVLGVHPTRRLDGQRCHRRQWLCRGHWRESE